MSEDSPEFAPEEHDADRVAREIGIPPCPAILASFSAEMRQPEPDLRKLAELISGDIALSAALLKLVNSPFYGLRTQAANPHQALSIIGLRAGANLVTGLILRQAFAAGGSALMGRFWDKANRTGAVAMEIARRIRGIDRDEAHTFAVFRDCGIPAMIGKFPDYGEVMDSLERVPGVQATAMEQVRYKYGHARVGHALARGWLLPEAFCCSILYHHDFEKLAAGRREVEHANRKLIAFGLLTEQVARLRSGGGVCPDWDSGERLVLDALAITPDQIVALATEVSDPA